LAIQAGRTTGVEPCHRSRNRTYRPVYLKAWNEAKINHVQYFLKNLSEGTATYTAEFEIEAVEKQKAQLKVQNEGITLASKTIELNPGTHNYSLTFEIKKPQLWWTNGLAGFHVCLRNVPRRHGFSG
jgi:beta-mannosidase